MRELGDRAIGDGTVAPVGAVAELCKYLGHRQEQWLGHLLLQKLRALVEGPTRKILKPLTAGQPSGYLASDVAGRDDVGPAIAPILGRQDPCRRSRELPVEDGKAASNNG